MAAARPLRRSALGAHSSMVSDGKALGVLSGSGNAQTARLAAPARSGGAERAQQAAAHFARWAGRESLWVLPSGGPSSGWVSLTSFETVLRLFCDSCHVREHFKKQKSVDF